jgi:hypothetical protein
MDSHRVQYFEPHDFHVSDLGQQEQKHDQLVVQCELSDQRVLLVLRVYSSG